MIQDTDLERAMIATVCCSTDALEVARDTLDADCFTDKAAREAWGVIEGLLENGDVVDLINVRRKAMDASPELTAEIDAMMLGTTFFSHFERLCNTLVDLKQRRRLYDMCVKLAKAVENTSVDYGPCAEEMRLLMENAGTSGGVTVLGDAVDRAVAEMLSRQTAMPTGTRTGFASLDANGGFHPQQLIVIGGCTGNGKTSLALSISLNMVEDGARIAYYSLEMSDIELTERLVAIKSRVDAATVQYGCPTNEEWGRIDGVLGPLRERLLFFDDKATSRLGNIMQSIRSLRRKREIDGAVIDYLQVLPHNTRSNETQAQVLGGMCRMLKNLAKELDIWIVALSQISRGGPGTNPQPTLHRLRGSGEIEEASDIVLLVYRPEIYGVAYAEADFAGKETRGTALVHIAKRRGGPTGKFLVAFDAQYTHFHEGPIADRPGPLAGTQEMPRPQPPAPGGVDEQMPF